MHTESEARGLWCPMARTYDADDRGGATATNRPLDHYGGLGMRTSIQCIASACAMWRWNFLPSRSFRMALVADSEAMTEPARPAGIPPTWTFCPYNPDDGEPAGWAEPVSEYNARRQGYCGLAPLPKD
jgi:hypothetical protein